MAISESDWKKFKALRKANTRGMQLVMRSGSLMKSIGLMNQNQPPKHLLPGHIWSLRNKRDADFQLLTSGL